eukprot:CAMPEP_0115730744 /NCGR_PEP_ID=MMETSP0272-20121206/84199_1 /TAXON_ID=71861 /ORGANISM="Scrippsiella trochoidea, Strain CCMP3099" /LENGTH=116 /DNA_ID=CAMNT_0003174503 /DNA_START=105 /DNA_END=453 /DNA_ORIENTATION=+
MCFFSWVRAPAAAGAEISARAPVEVLEVTFAEQASKGWLLAISTSRSPPPLGFLPGFRLSSWTSSFRARTSGVRPADACASGAKDLNGGRRDTVQESVSMSGGSGPRRRSMSCKYV